MRQAQAQDHSQHQMQAQAGSPTTGAASPCPNRPRKNAPPHSRISAAWTCATTCKRTRWSRYCAWISWNGARTMRLGWNLRAGIGRNFDKLWLRSEGEKPQTPRRAWRRGTAVEPCHRPVVGPGDRHAQRFRRRVVAPVAGARRGRPGAVQVRARSHRLRRRIRPSRRQGRRRIRDPADQPSGSCNPSWRPTFTARTMPKMASARDFSDAEFGLRLRYEFSPQFAPYVGYAWSRRFGETARFTEAVGGRSGRTRLDCRAAILVLSLVAACASMFVLGDAQGLVSAQENLLGGLAAARRRSGADQQC